MKVTVFSSNQPRHLNLVKELSKIVENVYFISEVNTVFPGKINDFFRKTDVMQKYFYNVMNSEVKIFKNINFLPLNVRCIFSLKFSSSRYRWKIKPSSSMASLIDSLKSSTKSSKVIKQTMINEKKNDDQGTMLDESQLIDE